MAGEGAFGGSGARKRSGGSGNAPRSSFSRSGARRQRFAGLRADSLALAARAGRQPGSLGVRKTVL
eukprot:3261535-Lingulodinium_polyedra.AAC.1